MPDDRERWEPNGRERWLSTRGIRPAGDFEWPSEVRSIDSWLNPCVAGNYVAYSLDDVWNLLNVPELLPAPAPGREYHIQVLLGFLWVVF